MKAVRVVFAVVLLVLVVAPRLPAQDSIAAARDLYAGAAYEDALTMLGRLKGANDMAGADARAVDQYRAFCLLALGRQADAERAIEEVVNADAYYQPGEAEVSPRVRTAFRAVRQRMLPGIIQQKYAMAKATYDRKEWAAAADQFTKVLTLIDDPDMDAAKKEALGDLKTLAAGFLDLAKTAATPPPPPKPQPPPPPATPPPPAVYSTDDPAVVPPVVIRQDMPPYPRLAVPTQPTRMRGLLELIIAEDGSVESAVLRRAISRLYDDLLLAAAKRWKYQPATREGKPVKFRKVIDISIDTR